MELQISLLTKSHDKANFCCGKDLLDNYIKFRASQDVKKRLSVCFVLADIDDVVKGFFTLSNSSIANNDIPEK